MIYWQNSSSSTISGYTYFKSTTKAAMAAKPSSVVV